MSLSRRLVLLVICFAAALTAQPVVTEGGAVNVASYVPARFPNYGLAQGSLFTVFGQNMGPSAIQFVQTFPVPTALAGSSIKVTVGNTTVDCLMIFSAAGQLAAILPSNTPLGAGTLRVTFNGQTSNAINIRVVAHDPGILTISANGLGPAVITDPFFVPNTVVNSFAPGDPAVLWVTGLGARSQDATPQQQDLQGPLDLTLRIGSKVVTNFLYAGPAPTNAGLDQVNFFIPEDAEEGCAVSVVLQVGDAVSNFSRMSISSDDPVCDDDPLALARAEIKKQRTDGTIRVALGIFDTNLTNAAVITGNPAIDTPGSHDGRTEVITARLFEAPFNVANPLVGIAPGSCAVVDQVYANPAPPATTNPLPTNVTPSAFAKNPSNTMLTLPGNLVLTDNNTAQSAAALTFVKGQEWSADFALVNSALMRTDEAHVSHVLRMDPEAFAGWNPSAAEAKFMGVFRGDSILQDLTVADLPTTADHLVVGTFIIQNPFWRTTVTCTTPGTAPVVFPRHAFHSINCGPQSRCNGGVVLNIVPRGPSTVGTTFGTPNSIGKINGYDRVMIFFSFTLPATVEPAE
jgi:uncharacterized protein (TIGR03437 family)